MNSFENTNKTFSQILDAIGREDTQGLIKKDLLLDCEEDES